MRNRITGIGLALLLIAPSLNAQQGRKVWAEVADPTFISIGTNPSRPERIEVAFEMAIGTEGADKATVELLDSSGAVLEAKPVGRSKSVARTVDFAPPSSGEYAFRITATRAAAEPKISGIRKFSFVFPLRSPAPRVLNQGGGSALVKWEPVAEADAYTIRYTDTETGTVGEIRADTSPAPGGTTLQSAISGMKIGHKYGFSVTALRGADRAVSGDIVKTIKAAGDREWSFAWFGQSSKAELNTMRLIDADNLTFSLNSCSVLADGQIDQKGGKFTTFHDGISFYYTVIDAARENFELSATFRVDYINPVADGQEGFGLLAMDSLGRNGVSMVNHYTNSAGVIATKFEAVVAGTKRTSKDTLGARFVSGITDEVIAGGDTGIARFGRSFSNAFSYDATDLVKAGDSFTLVLKKTNTGYHAMLKDDSATGNAEYIMYGPEKLLRLDKERVYVGFAAARGCNVTVSDVSMTITDPANDPPARGEPPELVPLQVKVDSPTTCVTGEYLFVFVANADGAITVVDGDRRTLVKGEKVTAGRDFVRSFALKQGFNDFAVTFTPDSAFRPGENQVMAAWDRETLAYTESYAPVSVNHSVLRHSYAGSELRVAPDGDFLGNGTQERPLDLETALLFAKDGQAIVLAGGVYRPVRAVTIPRGNDGRVEARRVLKSAPGERAILDFGRANGGMLLAGNFWTIDCIDVRSTQGNIKGLQVSGNDNIVKNVNTYDCGDTGLQISGNSAEPPAKWPRDNLILNCSSWNNCDPAANNADGFAAKLTCGEGNAFRGCIAFSNVDDGWDLFSKIESGPIGVVLIEDCVAFRNGSLLDGSHQGDGNGFKLGGDGIAVAHILRNSIAYDNRTSGITSNSDPAIVLERNTSYGNGQSNITLYGKGDLSRSFVARGNLSMKGGAADAYREMPELASPDNYFWDGARSVNSAGQQLPTGIFVSADLSLMPVRKPDGSIDMKGLLVLAKNAPAGIGAHIP
ncbi:MAG TPA: pectate lyase [Treponema sp.]|nr:pectate lyase [Treponema sp.]